MTWNLWWRFGPWERRRTAVLHTLRRERPDVLGLQEVWGSAAPGGENMARWLAAELGMHWTWSRSPVQDRWHGRNGGDTSVDVGIAVLSRHPLLETAELRLPAGDFPDDGKTALHALIDTPGGPLPFFTTHLNSGLDESAVRCAQVSALAAFVGERSAGHAHPPVVTGDFNAEPDFDEMRLLCGYKTAPAAPGLVLLDGWRFADPALPQGTWDMAHRDAAGFGSRPSCIDHILVGPPGEGGRGRVRLTRRAADTAVDGVWASDHAAVVTELALPS
ncbi:endonuclease/exonuclease/phosphatase family protein [Streptomyces sp. V4-01]|uniref:Endonuclease/exonuclease/phosphatase family protein n=1 Tax=Actinacidiphila polyblastidii TaxID=3110430 RepID=A0ABU7PHS6_9ACTN|nr:endonuclease/exonuclease/phosphatase family protein [Streptomyces sp. V4-01]